ncbi:MAG: hypothetical protein V3R76_10570 [Gammaproteobacteria bacterium]
MATGLVIDLVVAQKPRSVGAGKREPAKQEIFDLTPYSRYCPK